MRIGVPKETTPGERRVALVPESGKKLIQAGYQVVVETGAGSAAGFPDAAYRDAGVTLDAPATVLGADVVLKINPPEPNEIEAMRPGAIYLGSLMPLRNLETVKTLADRGVTAFSTDAVPRTTRAQSMDT
ncbi:MAG: NAD(P)(+) transhydrogenase (Re/Si-specific) subunit alpha, partial [Gemmatimonadales bacterium]|nr:NAD(P)(+) transhydrogenase (Re/Si-specific) subunit alpha [Gemmatimonadales bacterium]